MCLKNDSILTSDKEDVQVSLRTQASSRGSVWTFSVLNSGTWAQSAGLIRWICIIWRRFPSRQVIIHSLRGRNYFIWIANSICTLFPMKMSKKSPKSQLAHCTHRDSKSFTSLLLCTRPKVAPWHAGVSPTWPSWALLLFPLQSIHAVHTHVYGSLAPFQDCNEESDKKGVRKWFASSHQVFSSIHVLLTCIISSSEHIA